jgi:hypothetical protein
VRAFLVLSVTSKPPRIPAITVGLRPFETHTPSGDPVVSALLATISTLPGGGIRFAFALEGRVEALRVPEVDAPPPGPLWQHTCFEAFLSAPDAESYREYNFSPAGRWAASEFRCYREIKRGLEEENRFVELPVTSTQSENGLGLVADAPLALLPAAPVLRVGLSAVIEHTDGHLEYWAICHPAGKPDFHHVGGWTLRLDTRLVRP